MDYALHSQTEIIESSPLIILCHISDSPSERAGLEDHHAAEIEVITEGTLLTFDKRVSLASAVFLLAVVVCIQHVGSGILSYSQYAVQSKHSHLQGLVLGIQQYVFMRYCLGYASEGFGRPE